MEFSSGTTLVSATHGIANFSSLSINKPGVGYTLQITSASLVSAASNGFTITAATGNQLIFTTQPVDTTAGVTFGAPVQLTLEDNLGNTLSTATGNVTLSIGTNPAGGTLSGTTTVALSNGVANLPGISFKALAPPMLLLLHRMDSPPQAPASMFYLFLPFINWPTFNSRAIPWQQPASLLRFKLF